TILGPEERVRSFNREDLRRFVSEHYGAGQMILSAAGDVDHDTIVRLAENLFGGLETRLAEAASGAIFKGGERRVSKTLEQAHFALAFEGPGYCDDAIYTAQVYSVALGGGMSSRLFQEVREKRGLCYTIFAQTGAHSDTGMTTIYAGTSGEQLPELANLTMQELARAADDMNDAEIARARAQMKAGMLMGLESPSSRAERLARLMQIWGRIPPLEETVERIDAVTTAGVRDFAAHLAGQAPAALALYGPVDGAPDLGQLLASRAA
ncbi:MAG: pitrilysin family protein, partial [Planktotalea arctica]